jgi:hypothetical protein
MIPPRAFRQSPADLPAHAGDRGDPPPLTPHHGTRSITQSAGPNCPRPIGRRRQFPAHDSARTGLTLLLLINSIIFTAISGITYKYSGR